MGNQNKVLNEILHKSELTREELKYLLSLKDPEDRKTMFARAYSIKAALIGRKVNFRGLIEYSNVCSKDCLYCGIRCSNKKKQTYELSEEEVLDAVKYAIEARFGSVVLQSGEISNKPHTKKITNLIRKIKELSNNKLGITLSLGEQSEETYREWFEAGAHRYLLRIEVSNPALYSRLHPNNVKHDYQYRLDCLKLIKKVGYQVGTGVMIGLPYQTIDDLVDDLLFIKDFDVDMVGMGPYIEHPETPLYEYRHLLMPKKERFELALNMIAVLRILMEDINIASTTALQALDKEGREKGLMAGANIVMPNITPVIYREGYKLYEDKPGTDETPQQSLKKLESQINKAGDTVAYDEWGDSHHFENRKLGN
jgi:biotin synthase